MCTQSPWCYKGVFATVAATNLCPPNWSEDSNNGGWCNPPRVHFDMSKPAFMKIAQWKAGIVPVMYRRYANFLGFYILGVLWIEYRQELSEFSQWITFSFDQVAGIFLQGAMQKNRWA